MKVRKRCGNCQHYFININWEKCCVDEYVDNNGKRRIKLRDKLGMMGDTQVACERWVEVKRGAK